MKFNSLQELNTLPNNSVEFDGKSEKYQQESSKLTRHDKPLSTYQNLLYKRALYGLKYYEEKDLKKMHWERKRRIKRVNKRAQASINVFKQERVNQLCECLYECFFNENQKNKDYVREDPKVKRIFCDTDIDVDPDFINTLDLKSLGITKVDIVVRFINEGILPKDFYQLKEAV